MLRTAALAFSLLAPSVGQALCNGPSFYEGMPLEQQTELTQKVLSTPYATGNFWQANKGEATLTILGTMHLPDPRHQLFFDMAQPRLNSADLLLVEATLDDQSDMQIYLSRNPEVMTITDGPSLDDQLDPDLWEDVKVAAEARGLPSFMVAKMQPWFLNLSLAMPPCAMASVMAGEAGLDNMLMLEAAANGIPVAPLESWQDMLDLLMSGTPEEQIDALRMALIDPDIQDSLVVTLVDFYFAEQSAMGWYISDYTRDLMPGVDPARFDRLMGDLEQELLINRNRSWIPIIEQAAAEHDDIFIGFGAAHLFGTDGVLRLLEKEGWTVTSLTRPALHIAPVE